MPRSVRAAQREHTRRLLIGESRALFATKGYAAVGLAEIVAAAGVTKGALYHHFDSKTALFRAVLAEIQAEVGARVAAAAEAHDDPWEQLVTGCETFLTAATAPGVQRVLLIDGPAVLGWHEWRALDERHSARHLRDALTPLLRDGTLPPQPIDPLVHLLSGAMNETALWLATTGDAAALADARAALRRVLAALRADSPAAQAGARSR